MEIASRVISNFVTDKHLKKTEESKFEGLHKLVMKL